MSILDTASTLKSLSTQLPIGKIDAADFLKQTPIATGVGSLSPTQVTGLMSQAAATAKQISSIGGEISAGIGKFALSPDALEKTGFLKPGTVSQFFSGSSPISQSQLDSILKSPAVWTGKAGAGSLDAFLKAPSLQNMSLKESMDNAVKGLEKAGAAVANLDPKDLGAAVQNAVKFGTDKAADWLNGKAGELTSAMDGIAKGAQNAVSFVTKEAANIKLQLPVEGFTKIVNRDAIDNAVKGIIGDPKIPVPKFGQGLFDSLPNSALIPKDLTDLKELAKVNAERLSRGLSAISDAKNQVTGMINQAKSTIASLEGQVAGAVSSVQSQVTNTVKSTVSAATSSLSR